MNLKDGKGRQDLTIFSLAQSISFLCYHCPQFSSLLLAMLARSGLNHACICIPEQSCFCTRFDAVTTAFSHKAVTTALPTTASKCAMCDMYASALMQVQPSTSCSTPTGSPQETLWLRRITERPWCGMPHSSSSAFMFHAKLFGQWWLYAGPSMHAASVPHRLAR